MTGFTVAAICIFVLIVVPGFMYEAFRQLRRPGRSDSSFVETGRILLAGLGCGGLAAAIYGLLRILASEVLASVQEILESPAYVSANLALIFLSVAVYLLLALGIAIVVAQMPLGMGNGRVAAESAWVAALRRRPPRSAPQAWILADDGSEYTGVVCD